MFIVLNVGHQKALAAIPAHTIQIMDLTESLVGPIRRLHLMLKGCTEHFDLTVLGNKIALDKAQTEDARLVTETVLRVVEYAEFIEQDHVTFRATTNLMGYVEMHENALCDRIALHAPYCIGANQAINREIGRLESVKRSIVGGITEATIWW